MAALAHQTRNALLPALRIPFSTSLIASGLIPTFLGVPRLAWSIPSLQSLLELFPPFLLAVPKSKISHSRKSMRSANKGLKDKHSACTPSFLGRYGELITFTRHCQLSWMRVTKTCSQSMPKLLHISQSDVEVKEKTGWWG